MYKLPDKKFEVPADAQRFIDSIKKLPEAEKKKHREALLKHFNVK